ncbi:MAG: aminodeoxychorismate/anthranilate synthase component II [Trueperaceae bacterium]|nr:aminodeoxychorismate/anthranilate synthase component II [Trueperaceae bacterium]MCO5174834.1 aminodeoxychorismate/anthranilate synthase component II [Trueperaceae bacterium]MCW5818614.1 aminodeoxychorismate/anthranilate synthase component II [Trueperaceae bacterium]
MAAPRLLVVDNYDSFTYNLVQYVAALGADVTVWRNDAFAVADVEELSPDGVIVSPGPCTPREAGVSVELVRGLGKHLPMLGVCLGHQVIGEAYGGRVVRANRLVHGKTATIEHDGTGVFAGLGSPVTATRYHSLVVVDPPDELVPNAWTTEPGSGERVLMGVRHATHPVWGVQFHPESILTESGSAMLANFLRFTQGSRG